MYYVNLKHLHRSIVIVWLVFPILQAAAPAFAKQYSNPCRIADDDLCMSFFSDGQGILHSQVVERVKQVGIRVARQHGCSGL